MKQIKFGLSINEIQNAIKEIEKYKAELNTKCELFVKALADEGLTVAKSIIEPHNHGTGETLNSLRIEFDSSGDTITASLVVESEAILFLEFGAGIHYNNGNEHPKAGELGYGVGTYPGQTHAFDENGWWYKGEDGEWHHSYGLPGDMPMYKSAVAMRKKILKVAKEVFN